jgi:hypothetical protein
VTAERPILFSGAMMRALLAGTKAQTRRVVKPVDITMRCPYGRPGTKLWVRETWKYADWTEDGEPWIAYAAGGDDLLCRTFDEEWDKRLGDIWADLSNPENYNIDNRAADRRWRPSIHMPRWASRITLEITGVRVERLRDISEADAQAEGIERAGEYWRNYGNPMDPCLRPRTSFATLWSSINGPGSWDANPWVWVVEFRPSTASAPATAPAPADMTAALGAQLPLEVV